MVNKTNHTFSEDHLRFLDYIKAVGTGPKGNRHLSYDESRDCFDLILNRRVPDTLISAFLLGWRVQGESDEELQGSIDWLAETLRAEQSSGIEIGYPMDGKAKFPPIMLEASKFLPALAVHASYDRALGPKYGFTLEQFGCQSPNLTLHQRKDFLPQLSNLTDLRNDIGIRTAFNTIEKLNFHAPSALIGMHHAPYFDLYAALYAKHYKRLVIVQGHEGTPEILKKTKYKVIENGEPVTYHIDPDAFGIDPISAKDEMDLEDMKALLANPDANLAKMIRLNGAFIGWAAGLYESIEKGYMCLQD